MKKSVIFILSVLLMVSTFAACSSGSTPLSEPSSSPVPEATASPTASPTPDPVDESHVFSSYFLELIDDGAVIPDYEIYQKPASENGKGDTFIVMYGNFGEVYSVNGYLYIEFFEGEKNLYALCIGEDGSNVESIYESLNGYTAEVQALYTGFSTVMHAPTGLLFETYCNGKMYTDSWEEIDNSKIYYYIGKPSSAIDPRPSLDPTPSPTPKSSNESDTISVTTSQSNALKKAKEYLSFMCFSREGLIGQLEYEKFSHEDAVYAVDHCGADWNDQALGKAKEYLSFTSFSYSGLIDQLEYEGFTSYQAAYGSDNCNADWKEQAAKKAKEYLDFMSFSRGELIDQLIYEGFTHEQAEYGADQAGL